MFTGLDLRHRRGGAARAAGRRRAHHHPPRAPAGRRARARARAWPAPAPASPWWSGAAGWSSFDAVPGDPLPHHARELAAGHAGEPGAGAAPLRPAGRPPGRGARGRGRRGPGPRRRRGRGRGSPSRCPPAIAPLVAEKGSIAVDGVSLTVARGRARPLRGGAHPGDARPHHAGRGRARDQRSTWRPTSWRATWRGCASSPGTAGVDGGFAGGLGLRRRRQSVSPPLGARGRADRGGHRAASAAARWSSSSTTRTARTRATSASPPRRSRRRRSTSWPGTAAASSACR